MPQLPEGVEDETLLERIYELKGMFPTPIQTVGGWVFSGIATGYAFGRKATW